MLCLSKFCSPLMKIVLIISLSLIHFCPIYLSFLLLKIAKFSILRPSASGGLPSNLINCS